MCLDFLYLLDVILKFFTGIPYNEHKKKQTLLANKSEKELGYVYSHKKIALYYVTSTFFIDTISLIPFFLYF